MGTREKINENKKLGVGVGIAIIIIGIGIFSFQLRGSSDSNAQPIPTQAFYTDDNGKTFFKDDIKKVVPFAHNGKQAYRADVFKGADGKEFVGLIYRYTDAGRKEMEEFINKKVKDRDGLTRLSIERRGMEVKPVGGNDKAWLPNDEMTSERLQMSVKGPAGKPATLVMP
jgi:hypothetical protein